MRQVILAMISSFVLSSCDTTSYCDSYGDCCDEYYDYQSWCGGYDTADFNSMTDCCACQFDDKKSEQYKKSKKASKSKVAKATKKVATKAKVSKKSKKASKKHLKK